MPTRDTVPIPVLALGELATGFPHIPAECGAALAQAAGVCLENQGHTPGVHLTLEGDLTGTFAVEWVATTEPMRRFWNDLEEATEQGAYGLAILLMKKITGHTVIERSRKGTGFDWWLGEETCLFQAKARLEVSGILRGTNRRIRNRIAARVKQVVGIGSSVLPAYVLIVEFSGPRARVKKR